MPSSTPTNVLRMASCCCVLVSRVRVNEAFSTIASRGATGMSPVERSTAAFYHVRRSRSTNFIAIQKIRRLRMSSTPYDTITELETTDDSGTEGVFSEEIGDYTPITTSEWVEDQQSLSVSSKEAVSRIFCSSCLITANTIGSAILTLPDVGRDAGVVVPAFAFFAIYVINVITSLYISEQAIAEYEGGTPASEVPTSFKDIAGGVFGSTAGSCVAALSVLFNYCIIIFNVIRFGDTADSIIPWVDSNTSAAAFAALLTFVIATTSNVNLSKVTSVSVGVLFASFAALVLPGIPQASWGEFVNSSGGYFHGKATVSNMMTSLLAAAPLIMYSTEIQKIIPSVTKLCNFDRSQTFAAITVGGAIPIALYITFAYLVLGGGIDPESGGFFITAFAMAAVCGASVASSMSLSEEFESFLQVFKERTDETALTSDLPLPVFMMNEEGMEVEVLEELPKEGQTYSLPAVLLAVLPPLAMGLYLSNSDSTGIEASIKFAGAYLLPIFVWLFPALLEWKRQKEMRESGVLSRMSAFSLKNLSVYGVAACAVGLIGIEASQTLSIADIITHVTNSLPV